ncbi:hypothetical protein FS837_000219 [Tulasnella sp. UAMH 9824]|nr:hypothetical protein FS837_000219 [Tulasnella sp. UAMH 9824]
MSANTNVAEQEPTPAVNLYAYAASAIPPKMDRQIHLARGETPRGEFRIDTKIPRTLLEVHQINPQLISDRAQKYPIPNEEIPEPSPAALNALALPGRNHLRGNPQTLTRFSGMARTKEDVGRWIDQMVLSTAGALFNLIHASNGSGGGTPVWTIAIARRSPIQATPMAPQTGEDIIECEVSIMRRKIAGRNIVQTHLVVFSFPPWKVTPNDFGEFSKPLRFNPELVGPLAEPFETSVLTRREKMWYFIYDLCLQHNCRWFVITSADYWSFGFFGAGWRTAFASPPLAYFNRHPTVMQVLILWIMSSLYENDGGNHFVIPLRVMDIMVAESDIGEDDDEIANYEALLGYLQEDTPTEIDDRESAEGTTAGVGSGLLNGTLNSGAVVTRWGDEANGEFSSINVLQDQPGPTPADQSIFRQATLNSPQARGSRRFSPYPLPSSWDPQDSSQKPLSPVEESAGTSGNTAAGPSRRVNKGKGRAIDIAPADPHEALPTISNILGRTASAPASVLSLAFRTKPGATQNVRTVEKWRGKSTLFAEGAIFNDGMAAGPSGCGRPSGNRLTYPIDSEIPTPAGTPRSHRSSRLGGVAPSSPVAGPSFVRQGGVIEEEGEDVFGADE